MHCLKRPAPSVVAVLVLRLCRSSVLSHASLHRSCAVPRCEIQANGGNQRAVQVASIEQTSPYYAMIAPQPATCRRCASRRARRTSAARPYTTYSEPSRRRWSPLPRRPTSRLTRAALHHESKSCVRNSVWRRATTSSTTPAIEARACGTQVLAAAAELAALSMAAASGQAAIS